MPRMGRERDSHFSAVDKRISCMMSLNVSAIGKKAVAEEKEQVDDVYWTHAMPCCQWLVAVACQ